MMKKVKYILFFTFYIMVYIGKFYSNIKINFFSSLIWETFLIPSIIIVFWHDFFKIIPRVDSKVIKFFPKAFIVIIVYTVFYNFWCFYYFADIKNLLNKKYYVTEGTVSYVSIKNKLRSIQYFEINNRTYWNFSSDFIEVEKWQDYKVTTLQNTKYVINIEKIEKKVKYLY